MTHFKRREPQTWLARLQNYIWPQQGVLRTLKYYRLRLFRLPGTVHNISLGAAVGVGMSFMPLGLHEVMAIAVAWVIRCNVIASALVAFVFGNFALYLFLLGPMTIGLGELLWGKSHKHRVVLEQQANIGIMDFLQHPVMVLERFGASYFVGAATLILITMPITYVMVKRLVELAHKQRAERLRKRWLQRQQAKIPISTGRVS